MAVGDSHAAGEGADHQGGGDGAGKVAVFVLGGEHDLADAFRRQGLGVEFLRVTTRAYRKAAGER